MRQIECHMQTKIFQVFDSCSSCLHRTKKYLIVYKKSNSYKIRTLYKLNFLNKFKDNKMMKLKMISELPLVL